MDSNAVTGPHAGSAEAGDQAADDATGLVA